ncbi:hypothetical protein A7U60_g4603 [Sanghuangporus baumii]|uniref:Protein kinase domain-containing protein n=1 Tax=Sanghuangporus baumii TaxID=108892 RepID=A0A9Q5HY72_SANBA|nr:hypothetical protein A7U60_g4603 [Sanghuangporus baumii]
MSKENTSQVAKLVSAYNELLEARKNTIGKMMEETDAERENINVIQQWYSALKLDTPIRRSRMHDSFIRAFRKDFHNMILEMLEAISSIRKTYSVSSSFCAVTITELSWYLGDRNLPCNFELAWCVQFQQFFAEGTHVGLLDALGISYPGLVHWWTGCSDAEIQESRIWLDMKNLAHKMVYLLDKTNRIDDEWFSLPVVELEDLASQARIEEIIIPTLKSISQGIFRLLFLRQNDYPKFLPCFGTLVPTVYAMSYTVNLSIEEWKEMGSEAITLLEPYINILLSQYEALIEELGAEMEINSHEKTSLHVLKRVHQLGQDNAQTECDPAQERISFLRDQTVKYLESLGLRRLEVTLSSENDIGSGSFSKVFKCQDDNSHRVLAVKFLRLDRGDDAARVANRLLREAACWRKLKHMNVNMLQGFCIHPKSQLPGLVSDHCKLSLAQYINSPEGHHANTLEKLCFLYEVASGLDHMHQHQDKIAHGDVRPENILLIPRRLGSGYNAVLSDFGISYVDEQLTDIELTSLQCTNVYYIAPELLSEECRSKKRMVSIPGDIYAFGCVFLRVMYDLSPFYYESNNSVALKRKKINSSPLPAMKTNIRSIHWEFLERTWSAKPTRRPKADEVMIKMDTFKAVKE